MPDETPVPPGADILGDLESIARERAAGAIAAAEWIELRSDLVAAAMNEVVVCLRHGGTIFTCGNGGSAAEALHLAEELVGFYRDHDRAPRRAICLAADPTALTCIANDAGFEQVFARPLSALGRSGDILVCLSTSGNSANVVAAAETAERLGLTTIGLLGGDGGDLGEIVDHPLIVDAPDTASVQEGHLMLVHMLCEAVERDAPRMGRG